MKISITGATGFVGNLLSFKLIAEGHHVIAYVREPDTIFDMEARYFDLAHPETIELIGSDTLIHCAAYLPASFSDMSEMLNCWMYNTYATQRLLERAEEAGVKTFIYFSSGQIYDWKRYLGACEDDPIDTSYRAVPYLSSKASADCLVRHHARISKMRTVILRPSSIYGVGMKKTGLIPRLAARIKNDEKFDIKDIGGHYYVDLVHVSDVVNMASIAVSKEISGVYNVGGGYPISTSTLIETICRVLDKSLPYEQPKSMAVERAHSPLNIGRAQSVGYNPRNAHQSIEAFVKTL